MNHSDAWNRKSIGISKTVEDETWYKQNHFGDIYIGTVYCMNGCCRGIHALALCPRNSQYGYNTTAQEHIDHFERVRSTTTYDI